LSISTTSPHPDKNLEIEEDKQGRKADRETIVTRFRALWNYALVGAAASLLLGFIELVDVNFRLAEELQSVSERGIFCSYLSLNIAGGFLIGLLVGLCVQAFLLLNSTIQRIIARGKAVKPIHELGSGAMVFAIAAVVLNQQPQAHAYVLTIIREAEKFGVLTVSLLNHERSTSYLILMAFVAGCSVLWMRTRWLSVSSSAMRVAWCTLLIGLIPCAYYVDSRFEPLLYQTSVHRSMFLLATALSMSLIATIFSRSQIASTESALWSKRRRASGFQSKSKACGSA
jgi:hypothetical protein